MAAKMATKGAGEIARGFDEVLQEVGEFGFYQKRLLLLLCLTGGCVMMHNNAPVFTINLPKHRCQLPDYPNDTWEIQNSHHAWLVSLSIPADDKGGYQACTFYDQPAAPSNISADDGSGNRTLLKCDRWVYDRSVFTETLATQLDLVCERKIHRSTSNMMIFAGKFVGAFLSSACGDQFGRRRIYLFMVISMLGSAIGMVFVTSLPLLMVFRFLIGATTTGCYLAAYVIGMELMGTTQRGLISLSFKVSEIVMSLLGVLCAFLLRHWAHFQAALVLPCVLVLVGYFFIPESPRWLLSKGRLKETQKIVDEIARVNGAPPPKRMFIVMCIYGLMLNVSNMAGDIFLNVTLMTSVDVLSLVLYVLTVERCGRRRVLVVASGVGGLACLATLPHTLLGGSDWILRGLSIMGRWFMSISFMTVYVISPELFPTVLRSFGLGSCSMVARIGGLASPYIADLNTYVSGSWGEALPQVVFGASGLLTSAMMVAMPETRGRQLPETIMDAVNFGRNKPETKKIRRYQDYIYTKRHATS